MAVLVEPWSNAWLASVTEAVAGEVYDGAPSAVEITVKGGPHGARQFYVLLDPEGVRYLPGAYPDGEPPASFELSWDEANQFLAGSYEPVVGFMQGQLKVKGATRPLFELFRQWARPGQRRALAS